MDILRQTECMIISPLMIDSFASRLTAEIYKQYAKC